MWGPVAACHLRPAVGDLLEWHFGLVWPVRAAEKRTEPHVRGKAESGARCPDRASGSPGVVGASGSRRRVSDACHWLLGSRPSGDRDSRQRDREPGSDVRTALAVTVTS